MVFGFRIRTYGARVIFENVSNFSVYRTSDLEVGDQIINVNGRHLAGLDAAEADRLLNDGSAAVVELLVIRRSAAGDEDYAAAAVAGRRPADGQRGRPMPETAVDHGNAVQKYNRNGQTFVYVTPPPSPSQPTTTTTTTTQTCAAAKSSRNVSTVYLKVIEHVDVRISSIWGGFGVSAPPPPRCLRLSLVGTMALVVIIMVMICRNKKKVSKLARSALGMGHALG